MAINDPSKNNTAQDNGRDDDQRDSRRDERRNEQRAERRDDDKRFSPFGTIGGAGNLTGRRVNKNVGSEKFTKLLEGIKKVLKDDGVTEDFRLIPLNREQHGTFYSAIIVVRGTESRLAEGYGPHTHLTAQALLIEATNSEPRPYVDDSIRNNPIQVTRTSEDVYNDMFIGHVRRLVISSFNNNELNLIDPIVVPRDFDVENENTVRALAETVTTGLETRALVRHAQFADWNLSEYLGNARDMRLPVTVESISSSEPLFSVLGAHIHADAVISVSIEQTKQDRRDELNNPDGNEPICEAYGFTELVPVDPRILEDGMPRSGRRGGRDFVPEFGWVPRFNIVNLEQSVTRTPAGLLLPIASADELGKERRWAAPMTPRRGVNSRDGSIFFNDPGALNIQANLQNIDEQYAPPIDTSDAAFGDRELGILLDRTVTQRMAIGIHCTDTGPQAYYTSPFAALARGSSEARRRARADLVTAANALTNGYFDEFFHDNDDIVDGEGERFHMGFWRDNNQQLRDIRQIAHYLPMANMLHAMRSSMDLLDDWNDAVFGDGDEAERMAEKLQMLNVVTQETLVTTGTGLCVTLTGAFVDGGGR